MSGVHLSGCYFPEDAVIEVISIIAAQNDVETLQALTQTSHALRQHALVVYAKSITRYPHPLCASSYLFAAYQEAKHKHNVPFGPLDLAVEHAGAGDTRMYPTHDATPIFLANEYSVSRSAYAELERCFLQWSKGRTAIKALLGTGIPIKAKHDRAFHTAWHLPDLKARGQDPDRHQDHTHVGTGYSTFIKLLKPHGQPSLSIDEWGRLSIYFYACDTGRWIGFDELQRLVNMNGRAEAATKVRDQLDAKAMTQVIKTRPLLGSANEVVGIRTASTITPMLVQHVLVCKVNLEGQHAVHMKASSTLLGIDFRLSLSPLRVLGTPQEVDEAWQGLKAWIEDESKDSNLAALFLSPSGLAVAFQDQVLHLNNRVPQSVLAPVKAAWEVVQAEVSTQGDWGIEKVKGGLRIARGAAVDRVLDPCPFVLPSGLPIVPLPSSAVLAGPLPAAPAQAPQIEPRRSKRGQSPEFDTSDLSKIAKKRRT